MGTAKGKVIRIDGRRPLIKYANAGNAPMTSIVTRVLIALVAKHPMTTYIRKEKIFSPKKIFAKAPDVYPKMQNTRG